MKLATTCAFGAALLAVLAGVRGQSWEAISPGGSTDCIVGDYSYFVRRGLQTNLLIEFEGGGGCWDAATCEQGLAKVDVNVPQTLAALNEYRGIQDHFNPSNTFANWTHVYIPYCTADIHIGTVAENAYGVPHVGLTNGFAAFDWIVENVPAPEKVMTTGCSAGGYGAAFWAPRYMKQYPYAKQFVLNDSGNGVQAEAQYFSTLSSWGFVNGLASDAVPAYNDYDFEEFDPIKSTSDVSVLAAQEYPDAIIATFTTNADNVQAFFYGAGGGDPLQWSPLMREITQDTLRRAPNTAAMIDQGFGHCIIGGDAYYSKEVNGVKLIEWLDDMVNGREFSRFVDCCPPPTGSPTPVPPTSTPTLDQSPGLSTPTSAPTTLSPANDPSNTTAIVGGIIGAVVLAGLGAGIYSRKKRAAQKQEAMGSAAPTDHV